jgi:hypothetical protein
MKNLTTEEQEIRVENAKAVLKAAGYFVDNLWHVNDVKGKYICTDEEAQQVLSDALTNETTFSQIWFNIHYEAGEINLTKKEEE